MNDQAQDTFIQDAGTERKYFFMLPNLIDDLGLSLMAYRLYGHLKRVAGEQGKCWQSTTTLASSCNMSAGSVSKAKKELENYRLILIVRKLKTGSYYDEITVLDIWERNFQAARSLHERTRSPGETKNNTIKNNPEPEPQTASDDPQKDQAAAAGGSLTDLFPGTPGARKLFALLQAEAHSAGRKGSRQFETLAQKAKFEVAEAQLDPAELERALRSGLEQGITSRARLVSYVASWAKRQGLSDPKNPTGNRPDRSSLIEGV